MEGHWKPWYAGATKPKAYANTVTYQLGADWLKDCSLVEDWGCGLGWMRRYVDGERYRGIDGTASPYADEVVDLLEYRSEVPGIYMRHVLEHNFEWRTVLDNALASFTERMVLVLFTDMEDEDRELDQESQNLLGVPTLALDREDLISRVSAENWSSIERLETKAFYGHETIIRLERP